MLCSSCGAQFSPGIAVCPHCGKPAPDKASESSVEPTSAEFGFMEYSGAGQTQITPPDPTPQLYTTQQERLIGQMPGASDSYSQVGTEVSMPPPIYSGPQSQTLSVPVTPKRRRITPVLILLYILIALLAISGSAIYYLQIYHQVQPAPRAATSTPLADIYTQATLGRPVLTDPLSSQDAYHWEVDTGKLGGKCQFSGGAYHSSEPDPPHFRPCYAEATNFSNFAFQIQMTILLGDGGGILFRADNVNSKFYRFKLGQDGSYSLYRYTNNPGKLATLLASGYTLACKTGLGQANLLTVIARDSNIYLYVNQQFTTSVSDSTYSFGKIGVFANASHNPTEVAFSNAQVWSLS